MPPIPSDNAKDRDTCLCQTHSNLKMKAQKLKQLKVINSDNLRQLVNTIVCNPKVKECMYKECEKCKKAEVAVDKNVKGETIISWWEWGIVAVQIKIMKEGKEEAKEVKKTLKEQKEGTVFDLISRFQVGINSFCRHLFNIRQQFFAYRECRDNLHTNEALIHVDFSENYSCKLGEEVQSFHFGGSRCQVTLHTGIAYIGVDKIYFCSISPDKRHNPAAIWSHLKPILQMIRKVAPSIEVLHFFSDGPVTQYRQKHNFYLFNHQLFHHGFKWGTWSFFEAGHGKGPADGIGGALKRTADHLIAIGKDIPDANVFFDLVMKEDTSVKLFFIKKEEIEFMEQRLPDNIPVLKGTMRLHQLSVVTKGSLNYRDISCFCEPERGLCNCFKTSIYNMEKPVIKNKKGGKKWKQQQFNLDSQPLKNVDSQFDSMENRESKDKMIMTSKKYSTKYMENVEVTPNKIKKGVYVLAEFLVGKGGKSLYTYIAVTQDDLEEDGEVRVMFLKVYNDWIFVQK